MSETKDSTDKPASKGGRKPLSLQRTVESGMVRQNFSHGRSKSVVVEKRRSRKLSPPGAAGKAAATEAPEPVETKPAAKAKPEPKAKAKPETTADAASNLSSEERDARQRALDEARKKAAAAPPPSAPAEKPKAAETKAAQPASEAPAPSDQPAPKSAKPAPAGDSTRPQSARPRASLDPARLPRAGGRPKQIDIPSDIPPDKPEVLPKT